MYMNSENTYIEFSVLNITVDKYKIPLTFDMDQQNMEKPPVSVTQKKKTVEQIDECLNEPKGQEFCHKIVFPTDNQSNINLSLSIQVFEKKLDYNIMYHNTKLEAKQLNR